MWGLIQLIRSKDQNDPDLPFMNQHLERIAEDSKSYAWEVVRKWSEQGAPMLIGPKAYAAHVRQLWPYPTKEALLVAPFHMRLYWDVRLTGLPNYMSVRRDIPSQLKCEAWDDLLAEYEDKEICQFLRYGWPVTFTAATPPISTPVNHASAHRHPAVITKFIQKELSLDALLGPFGAPPFSPWTKISPLMTRDKPSGDGKRVIIDLSFPPGRSVNDGVGKNFFQGRDLTYTLPSPLDLAEEILKAGRSALLWKADLERAYRQMRIDPLYYPLLAIQHEGATCLDICPSFGCRCSGGAQTRVSNAVVHLMKKKGFATLAYVDDFAGVATSVASAEDSFRQFENLTATLGLKLAADKTVHPTTSMEFLGLWFDTKELTITIPEARLRDVLDEAKKLKARKSAPKQEVQSLAGKLNFISTCVRPGRKFMGRILAALRAADVHGDVQVTLDFEKDLNWFIAFAGSCNRRLMLQPKRLESFIECDACLKGGGGHTATHYYHTVYSAAYANKLHISQLEALNVVQALKCLIPPSHRGRRVIVRTDNIAAMYALNTGRTHDPVLASCAREIWLTAAIQDLDILLVHIPGTELVLADALSRRSFTPTLDRLDLSLVKKLDLTVANPVPADLLLNPTL